MERIALIVEATGERIRCLLNPDSIVIRRRAGLRAREGAGGLAGPEHADDPLLFVGGGWTEFELDLLFDTELDLSAEARLSPEELGAAEFEPPAHDVRNLTQALWQLSETTPSLQAAPGDRNEAKLVRFVWGQAWNVPGIVLSVAERLERFSPTGHPSRSWLRMRFRRVSERATQPIDKTPELTDIRWPGPDADVPESAIEVRESTGAVSTEGLDEEQRVLARPDLWSQEMYGTPFLWRLYAYFSDLDDPLSPASDAVIRFPQREVIDLEEPHSSPTRP